MAIEDVPVITGPNYGGVIYGLSLSVGYAKEPSKLTLDIVNSKGSYSPPTIGGKNKVSVSFGSFRFIGTPWSYSINESAAQKTLQVELIDGSVILDRYYVLLWKKGFFGDKGKSLDVKKTFNFSDIEYLVPKFVQGTIQFEKVNLGSIDMTATSCAAASNSGNILYVGTEEFKDSECTVPGTYYTLDQLKKVSPVDITFQAPEGYRSTHEGTLREVISQWCNETGNEFYWDFTQDNIAYYNSSNGISTVPDVSTSSYPNILEKSKTVSAEGTFKQIGFAYVIYPKEAIKSLLGTAKFSITVGINPYSIGYFFNKNGTVSSISDRESWGSRNQSQMLTAGFLGYINQSLRNIWVLYQGYFFAGGYNTSTSKILSSTEKAKAIAGLQSVGCAENIAALEKIDGTGLPNYDFYYADFDEGWLNTFQQVEQEAIQFLGKYYQHSGKSGKFFYCSNSSIIEINVNVQPEGSYVEELSEGVSFKGRKLFVRQGTMSHDSQTAAEALGLNESLIGKLEQLQPWHYEFSSGTLPGISSTSNVLAVIPKSTLVDKLLPRFSVSFGSSNNARETTIGDLISQSSGDTENNCGPFDDVYKAGSCQTAREKAEQLARDKVIPAQKPEKQLIDGLLTRSAKSITANLGSGRLTLCGPSDSQYQVIYNYTINANFLKKGAIETIKFEGTGATADNVARLEVIEDNVTDPTHDDFSLLRKTNLPKAVTITNSSPQTTIKYVFAGEPSIDNLSVKEGLSGLDVSLSDDGFKTTVTFSTRPKQRTPVDSFVRKINSQINRTSINAT
ncbi:MAG: hypothetical protein RL736_208 [Pseudomonadota bacterium]|jgi:hypothetical protein